MPSDVNHGRGSSFGGYKGEYVAPGHKASTVRGSYMSDDMAGVEYGLSMGKDMDSNHLFNVMYNNAPNPINGNVRQVPEPYESKSMKEKGHTFRMC